MISLLHDDTLNQPILVPLSECEDEVSEEKSENASSSANESSESELEDRQQLQDIEADPIEEAANSGESVMLEESAENVPVALSQFPGIRADSIDEFSLGEPEVIEALSVDEPCDSLLIEGDQPFVNMTDEDGLSVVLDSTHTESSVSSSLPSNQSTEREALADKDCWKFLFNEMPHRMKKNKVLQKLFIK